MKRFLSVTFLLALMVVALSLAAAAQNCSSPPTGFGGAWWRAYAAWCSGCGGTPNVNTTSCTPGPNWGRSGGSSGANSNLYGGAYSAGYQLGQALGRWLFNPSANANAAAAAAAERQRRLEMMAELQRRQAEAERQRREEDARRLREMYNRLANSLKMEGLPQLAMKNTGTQLPNLQLKLGDNTGQGYGIPGLPGLYVGGPRPTSSDESGLQLKLGDSNAAGSEHAGIPNLPGLALNDGEQAYGIPGLPGIYVGGPGPGSGMTGPNEPKLQMKMGDGDAPPAAAGLPADPRDMTPKQAADIAEMVSKLPPEEQERVLAGVQSGAAGGPPVPTTTAGLSGPGGTAPPTGLPSSNNAPGEFGLPGRHVFRNDIFGGQAGPSPTDVAPQTGTAPNVLAANPAQAQPGSGVLVAVEQPPNAPTGVLKPSSPLPQVPNAGPAAPPLQQAVQTSPAGQQLTQTANLSQQAANTADLEQAKVTAGIPFDQGVPIVPGAQVQAKPPTVAVSTGGPANPPPQLKPGPAAPATTTGRTGPSGPNDATVVDLSGGTGTIFVDPARVRGNTPAVSSAIRLETVVPAPDKSEPMSLKAYPRAVAIEQSGILPQDAEAICQAIRDNAHCSAMVVQHVDNGTKFWFKHFGGEEKVAAKPVGFRAKSSELPELAGLIPKCQKLSKLNPEKLEDVQKWVKACLAPEGIDGFKCQIKKVETPTGTVEVLADENGRIYVSDYDPIAIACDENDTVREFKGLGRGGPAEAALLDELNPNLKLKMHMAAVNDPDCKKPSIPPSATVFERVGNECQIDFITSDQQLAQYLARHNIKPCWQ